MTDQNMSSNVQQTKKEAIMKVSKTIVGKGLRTAGHVVRATGDTATKKAGSGVAVYGAVTLDPVTLAAGLALRFHDKLDGVVAKAQEILGVAVIKPEEDDKAAVHKIIVTPERAVMVGGMQYQASLLPEDVQAIVQAGIEHAEAADNPSASDIALLSLKAKLQL